MSLMPPTIIRDLRLVEHGYHVVPMGPSFIAFPDGRHLLLHDEAARDATRWPSSPRATPTRLGRLRGLAARRRRRAVAAAAAHAAAPRVAAGPGDLLDQLRMAWGMRGLDVRGTAEATRLFTMSIADVLDEWFESDEIKGVLAINGVIGTWAGPAGAGHRLRDDAPHDRRRRRRAPRLVGVPDRRHGRRRRRHPPVRRVVRGRRPHVDAGRAHRRRRRTRPRRHHDATGRCCARPIVVAATHPQITFLRQIDPAELPDRLRRRPAALALPLRHGEGQRRAVRAARLPRLAGHRAARALHRLGRAVPLDGVRPAGVRGRPRRPGRDPPVLATA